MKKYKKIKTRIIMNNYTIECTPEQTRKAIDLGAPIRKCGYYYKQQFGCNTISETDLHMLPIAEQMMGWLEKQDIFININHIGAGYSSWLKTI